MGAFNLGNVGDISSLDDIPKIRQYLYRLNEQLRYMFDNLSPEDNYGDKALLQYVSDGEKQSALEISLDQISLSMVDKDNIVAAINMSKEQVQIQADKIKMEGLVTVNSYFKIGLDGSIEARNGKFSGHISASSMESSTIDSTTINLGGKGKDGKVVVRDKDDILLGQWDKNGIDVKKGSIRGTKLYLGGNGEPGELFVNNKNNIEIGKWTKDGLVVKLGDITGTAITLGGTGTSAGSLTVLNETGTATLGTWNKNGIAVNKGSIQGSEITVGGSGNTGKLIVLDNAGSTTIGLWDNTGINVYKGSIRGSEITVGGSGNTGKLKVLDNAGTTIIGLWDNTGINVYKGSISGTEFTAKRGNKVGFHTDGTNVQIGDFYVMDWNGRQVLQSEDFTTGISGEPDISTGYYLWAGWYDDDDFVLAVDANRNVSVNGQLLVNGTVGISGSLVLNGIHVEGFQNRLLTLEEWGVDYETRISRLERIIGSGS